MKPTSIYLVLALCGLTAASLYAARVVLALYALELGAQPVTIGALAAMSSLLPTLLAVAAGHLADRFGSQWLLMFGSAAGGVGMVIPYALPGLRAICAAGG